MRRNPHDAQLALLLPFGLDRYLEHAGLIPVVCEWPTVPLQVGLQQQPVLLAPVLSHEARQEPARGVVIEIR